MKLLKYFKATAASVVITTFLIGCLSHQMNTSPATSAKSYPAVIERAKKDKKYIILYSGVNLYTLVSVQLDKAKENMTVQLDKVDSMRLSRVADTGGEKPVNSNASASPVVHVYMKDSTSYTLDEPHTIPLAKVAKIEWAN